MARTFISYSRKNKDFCKRLTDELQKRDLDLWVDWDDIPPTVDWKFEIQKGIEEADTFLAIVSTDWISSPICKDELELAVKNGKRLIPVVPYDIVWNDVPPALAQLNFIFFTENFDFNAQFDKLLTALDTDYDWLKTQRRLQVKALEWERSNKDHGFLLRGRDLEEAEQQISVNATKDPNPTDIQREYILASRHATDRQRRNTIGVLTTLVAVMIGIIALLVQPYVEDAISKAQARNQSPMILVPAGNMEFWLGDFSQPVDFTAFNIEMHPVTNHVYGLCVKVGKCTPPIGSTNSEGSSKQGENEPVVWLTIDQAATYCKWVGRRLPSAPEWEYAAGKFASKSGNQFAMSNVWEWTSSYQENNSQGVGGRWDGQLDSLNLNDWAFLQENGNLDPAEIPTIYTNLSGPFGATDTLGFRCVDD